MSHVHMQTSSSFQKIEQHPPQVLAVAKPLTVPTLWLMHLPTVLEKQRLFIVVKIQPFRQPLGLGISLSAPESQGWDLYLCLQLTSSYRPTGQDTGL